MDHREYRFEDQALCLHYTQVHKLRYIANCKRPVNTHRERLLCSFIYAHVYSHRHAPGALASVVIAPHLKSPANLAEVVYTRNSLGTPRRNRQRRPSHRRQQAQHRQHDHQFKAGERLLGRRLFGNTLLHTEELYQECLFLSIVINHIFGIFPNLFEKGLTWQGEAPAEPRTPQPLRAPDGSAGASPYRQPVFQTGSRR